MTRTLPSIRSVCCKMLWMRKRTSDSRGLHPSASPHQPPIRPLLLFGCFVRRRRRRGEAARGGDRGEPETNTSHARSTQPGGNFDLDACDAHDNEEKEPHFCLFLSLLLSLGGLDESGVCNILLLYVLGLRR